MSLEKLWDDLMLEPPIKLYDLMSRVKKYAQLKDGARLRSTKECCRPEVKARSNSIRKVWKNIKDESNKKSIPMGSDASKRNQKWKCSYYKERGNITEDGLPTGNIRPG